MKNRNVLVLVTGALALLLLAYLLSRSSADAIAASDAGPGRGAKQRPPVVYPRDQRPKTEGALATDRTAAEKKDAANLDLMQRALLGPGKKGALFVEANAIRHAPLMEKILRCRDKEAADGLERLKNELGIDPTEDIDRIGFDGDVFAASGYFDNLKLPPDIGPGTPYGDGARLWSETSPEGEKVAFAKLGNGLLLTGVDEAQLKSAIDRAEGRDNAASADSLPAGFGQGEIYGTVGAAFIQSLFGSSENPIAQNLARLVTSSTVRMNVDEDAALSLDMQAVDEKSARDLTDALKGGLALLRADAQKQGDEDLASLLEQARVDVRADGRFDVDIAVPGEVFLKGMGCNPDGTPLAPRAETPIKPAEPSPTKSDLAPR